MGFKEENGGGMNWETETDYIDYIPTSVYKIDNRELCPVLCGDKEGIYVYMCGCFTLIYSRN